MVELERRLVSQNEIIKALREKVEARDALPQAPATVDSGDISAATVIEMLSNNKKRILCIESELKRSRDSLAIGEAENARLKAQVENLTRELTAMHKSGGGLNWLGRKYLTQPLSEKVRFTVGDTVSPREVLKRLFLSRMSDGNSNRSVSFESIFPVTRQANISERFARLFTFDKYPEDNLEFFAWLLFELDVASLYVEYMFAYVTKSNTLGKSNVNMKTIHLVENNLVAWFNLFLERGEQKRQEFDAHAAAAFKVRESDNGALIKLVSFECKCTSRTDSSSPCKCRKTNPGEYNVALASPLPLYKALEAAAAEPLGISSSSLLDLLMDRAEPQRRKAAAK